MTTQPEAPEEALPELPAPSAFRARHRSELGMIGSYPWYYAEKRTRQYDRPECEYDDLFTVGQMRAYARAAIAQRRAKEAPAVRDVLAERRRQVEVEGLTPEHDDEHDSAELALAASTYALLASGMDSWRADDHWPWDLAWLKKSDPRRMLVKAAALILAEIERLDRATTHTKDATA